MEVLLQETTGFLGLDRAVCRLITEDGFEDREDDAPRDRRVRAILLVGGEPPARAPGTLLPGRPRLAAPHVGYQDLRLRLPAMGGGSPSRRSGPGRGLRAPRRRCLRLQTGRPGTVRAQPMSRLDGPSRPIGMGSVRPWPARKISPASSAGSICPPSPAFGTAMGPGSPSDPRVRSGLAVGEYKRFLELPDLRGGAAHAVQTGR